MMNKFLCIRDIPQQLTVETVVTDFYLFNCYVDIYILRFICYRLSVEFKIKHAHIENTAY